MTSTLGAIAVALALTWVFGGLALRVGGALIFWVGLAGLAGTANPQAILVALVGALAWLGGQGHYMLRHGVAKSTLAQFLFAALAALWHRLGRIVGLWPPSADQDMRSGEARATTSRLDEIEEGIRD